MEEISRQAIDYCWKLNILGVIAMLLLIIAIRISLRYWQINEETTWVCNISCILLSIGILCCFWGNICLMFWPQVYIIKYLIGR